MSLTYPIALLGLLALPYILWLGRPLSVWGRGRRIAALVLRLLIVLALVLSLAGLQIVRAAEGLAVVFLIDASDSMPPAAIEQARAFAADAIREMRPGDQAAIIVYGSDAVVERPMSASELVGPIESRVITLNTDLAEAIRLGMALFPPGAARRMVILSDGLANVGDAEEAARLAAASGVQLLAVPVIGTRGVEVLVADVDVPTRLNEGQVFDVTVTIESSEETTALLRIFSGGEVAVEENVALVQGLNRFTFPLQADEPGLTSFRAQIIPELDDSFYQNNELSAFTQVVGPPRVLVVSQGDPLETENLENALLAQGLVVDRVPSTAFPADLSTLSAYQSIVLANVPARDLGPAGMNVIRAYVRDLGGGLVAIGGPNSFAPGGYFQTPLEEVLPVEMQLKDQERLPRLTVVYVIDKSGSMSDTSLGGIQKIELAKEAILRSVNLLSPLDRVGVISFDENASYLVPISPADNRTQIAMQVAGLRASGGTDIYAGVLAVSQVLPDDPGELRHVVLLTDGGASPVGIPELVQQMYQEHGITFSVIAIGQGYAEFIETLPELAEGRFHYAYNVDTIPEIFSEETVIATRAYVIEHEFVPSLASTSPILTGISGAPLLRGYVGSTIKPAAQMILVAENRDPLLAAWQYGLGRSVAFTSDASGRWAAEWLNWEGYPRFWSQAVRWTITEGASQNVEVRVLQEGEQARVIVDALADDGSYLNGLDLQASVVQPDVSSQPLALVQVAPGRYEGTFTPDQEGAYFVRVAGTDPESGEEQVAIAQTSGWVLAYSPEYRSFEGDPDYLQFVSGLTDGYLIDTPGNAFTHDLRVDRASQPVWPWLLLFAAILLPFDIAVRRLVITRSDLQRLARWLGLTRRPVPSGVRTSRAGVLFAAKERAANRIEGSGPGLADLEDAAPPDPGAAPTPAVRREPPADKRGPQPRREPASGSATVSSLLERKRTRRSERED